MSSILLNIIIQTIPKVPANEYQDSKLIIKSRNAWKKDIILYSLLLVTAIISIFIFDKLPVPYIGTFLFLYGIFGTVACLFMIFRAAMIYRHYYDIYKEEDIKKIEE